MKITLHLGVIDIPYGRAHNGRDLGKTTFEVAKILEKKYGVMAFFAGAKKNAIGDEVTETLADYIEDALGLMLKGEQPTELRQLWLPDTKKMFDDAIESKFFDGKIAGVATQASLDGVNHRKKNPYKKRAARQSFLDTHKYRDSFKAWINGD